MFFSSSAYPLLPLQPTRGFSTQSRKSPLQSPRVGFFPTQRRKSMQRFTWGIPPQCGCPVITPPSTQVYISCGCLFLSTKLKKVPEDSYEFLTVKAPFSWKWVSLPFSNPCAHFPLQRRHSIIPSQCMCMPNHEFFLLPPNPHTHFPLSIPLPFLTPPPNPHCGHPPFRICAPLFIPPPNST